MRPIPIFLLLLLISSCSGRAPSGLWADPSLDAQSLKEGIVIGGVVDFTAERDLFDQQRDARILEAVFADKRPTLARTPWSTARSLLDPDSLDAILESYRRTGRLSAKQLATLKPLTARGRYLALVRIDLDQTSWAYPRRVRESIDRTVVDLEPESRRTMSMLFDLYDLSTSRLAYTMPVERTGIEHGNTRTVEGIDNVPTEHEVREAMEDIDRSSERPEPAERGGLIKGALNECVSHLP